MTSNVPDRRVGLPEATLAEREGLLLTGRFLAAVFRRPPSERMLEQLGRLLDELPMPLVNPELEQAAALLGEYGRNLRQRPLAEAAEELRQDFIALFEGPGAMLAPPWESVYRTEEQLLFGPTTVEVRQAYARWGLGLEHPGKEPEDHISFELQFLLLLLERLDRDPRARPEAAAFLQEHQLTWVRPFCTLVEDGAGTGFYQGLSRLLLGWVQAVARHLH